LKAINELIETKIYTVNTKKIRQCLKVPSSNRSKINFIWRSLKLLAQHEKIKLLEKISKRSPVHYRILRKEPIDIRNMLDIIIKDSYPHF